MRRILVAVAFCFSLTVGNDAHAEWSCRTQSGSVSVGGDTHQVPEQRICEWTGGGGDGGNWDGGGWIGGGGGPIVGGVCPSLMAVRPVSCPNPIPKPAGPYYADDKIPTSGLLSTSSMRMAISFAKGVGTWQGLNINASPRAMDTLRSALERQTELLADGASLSASNYHFRNSLASACDQQVAYSNGVRGGITPTKAELFCFEMMKAFDAEANDRLNFVQWFINYSQNNGVPLEAYVPYGIVELSAPNNSIAAKSRAVTDDASCSAWWVQVKSYGCGGN